jgi:DNA-binding transcriptional regulator YdaS (Cro superfamily)
MPTPLQALHTAINRAGGASRLARRIGVSQPAITQWSTRTKKVPAAHVRLVATLTGVAAGDLRPDLYGPLVKGKLKRNGRG